VMDMVREIHPVQGTYFFIRKIYTTMMRGG
jgi:hypothetical protein